MFTAQNNWKSFLHTSHSRTRAIGPVRQVRGDCIVNRSIWLCIVSTEIPFRITPNTFINFALYYTLFSNKTHTCTQRKSRLRRRKPYRRWRRDKMLPYCVRWKGNHNQMSPGISMDSPLMRRVSRAMLMSLVLSLFPTLISIFIFLDFLLVFRWFFFLSFFRFSLDTRSSCLFFFSHLCISFWQQTLRNFASWRMACSSTR